MDELLTIAGYIAAAATVAAFIGIPIAHYRSKKKARDEQFTRRLDEIGKAAAQRALAAEAEAPKRRPNRGG